MTAPDVAELARGLTEAQRRLVLASEPGGWGDPGQACGVELHGRDYRVARALEGRRLGTYTHGSPICDLYFNSDLGLQVRAYLSQPPKTIGEE
jgi:hypothetical protein